MKTPTQARGGRRKKKGGNTPLSSFNIQNTLSPLPANLPFSPASNSSRSRKFLGTAEKEKHTTNHFKREGTMGSQRHYLVTDYYFSLHKIPSTTPPSQNDLFFFLRTCESDAAHRHIFLFLIPLPSYYSLTRTFFPCTMLRLASLSIFPLDSAFQSKCRTNQRRHSHQLWHGRQTLQCLVLCERYCYRSHKSIARAPIASWSPKFLGNETQNMNLQHVPCPAVASSRRAMQWYRHQVSTESAVGFFECRTISTHDCMPLDAAKPWPKTCTPRQCPI